MIGTIFKKSLVIGILILFFGASILPCISGNNNFNINLASDNQEKNKNDSLDKNLIGYWSFNNAKNPTKDDSHNGRDGVNYGAYYQSSGGLYGSGYYEFSGDGYIDIPNTNGLAFHNQDFSFSLWFQIYDNSDNYRYFICLGDPNIYNYNYASIQKLRSGYEEGEIQATLSQPSGGYDAISNLNGDEIPKYTWIHIVSVYDYSNHELRIYYNNVLQDNVSYLGTFDLSCSPLKLNIGRTVMSYAYNYLVGKLDDVKIYNKALTGSEINYLYNLGKNPLNKPTITGPLSRVPEHYLISYLMQWISTELKLNT